MASSSNKFPIKLYNILQEAEKTPRLAEIVSWSPDGKSFKVHQKDEFSKAILPATFGTNVYKSFQRNLHFWGYQNIRKGPSKGVCSHPCFLRDRPELLSKMRRVRAPSKSNEHDSRSHDELPLDADAPQNDKAGVPAFVFASGTPHRVISPSMSPPSHLAAAAPTTDNKQLNVPSLSAAQIASGILGGNSSNTAALFLLLQQQQQQQQQHLQLHQNREAEEQQQHALAESLLVRHLLAQHEQQQQQQKLIQELLLAGLGQVQQPPATSSEIDQNTVTRAIVSQLLQQPAAPSNASSLLASFLR